MSKTKRKPKPHRTRKQKCSDCGATEAVPLWKVKGRGMRPRCSACGGPLNNPSHVD